MPPFVLILGVIILVFGFTALTGAPYVPSQNKELREAFKKLYPLSEQDYLIDFGSGDGKVLKIASEFGASGAGIELNPLLVLISKIKLRKNKSLKTYCGNMFAFDFPADTTVVYVFGDGRDMKKIIHHIEGQAARLGKPLMLVSHAFTVDNLKPIKQHRAYYLYKISAKEKNEN